MIPIKKGSTPNELVRRIKVLKSTPDVGNPYDELGSDVHGAVLKKLVEEQGGLCAYCMSRIDASNAHIEHLEPQATCLRAGHPERTVDYGNMVAVCCGGEGGPPEDQTCDRHRGETPFKAIDPLRGETLRGIRYSSNGMIAADDPDVEDDLVATLNLNSTASHLPDNRKAVYAQLALELAVHIKRGETKKAFCRRVLTALREGMGGKQPFEGVSVYHLERWLRASS